MRTDFDCDTTCKIGLFLLGTITLFILALFVLVFHIGLFYIIVYKRCLGSEKKIIENPTINIHSNQDYILYHIGDDVTIRAIIDNSFAVRKVKWHKKTENGSHEIDMEFPRYAQSTNKLDQHHLTIQDCTESDAGRYYLTAVYKNKDEATSNDIQLDMIKDIPKVTLSKVSEALYKSSVKFKASIRSFPKHTKVKWMKGMDFIDITQLKYKGSSVIGDCPVLCINNVSFEDKAEYTIEVHNEYGKGIYKSEELKIIGDKPRVVLRFSKQSQSVLFGNTVTLEASIISSPRPSSIQWKKDENIIPSDGRKFIIEHLNESSATLTIHCLDFDDSGKYTIIVTNSLGSIHDETDINVRAQSLLFISGPVVVLPSKKIQLQTIYPSNSSITNGKWFRTKNDTTIELPITAPGYSIATYGGQPIIQKIEIDVAKENEGVYHLSLNTMKSNNINVFVDDSGKFATEEEGNCLRFFALQSVSGKAMRIVFDRMSPNFKQEWQKFEHYCKRNKKDLPSTPPTSSNDLDTTIMYSMFRNILNVPPPTKGWGKVPDVNDTNTAADIERLRLYRNKISHVKSSEMTTTDFNESVLDLIQAIRRLTNDDEQLLKMICDGLNKVFCKGSDMDRMLEDLKQFRKLTAENENLFKEDKDDKNIPGEIHISRDKKAIWLTGRSKLYLGEKARFTAFINPNVSALSRVCWQKKNLEGGFNTININDGKYTGSSVAFPTPQLYIHFIRKEDKGTYRIVVDSFNKVVQNSIELEVKEGECDKTSDDTVSTESESHRVSIVEEIIENVTNLFQLRKEETGGGNAICSHEIGFHYIHDSNIKLLHNNTIARKINGEDINGVCFTNRPIKIGEKIFVRIAESHAKWSSSMDFGLTNEDPKDTVMKPGDYISLSYMRKIKRDEAFNYLPDFNDVLCFTLNRNATLSFSINDIRQPTRSVNHVSANARVWLVFDLFGKTRAIEISTKKPKDRPFNSYFREYSF